MAEKVETRQTKKAGIDWLTVGAIFTGVSALGIGLYMVYWNKEAFGAGDTIYCTYKYKHKGPGGPFIFRVMLGNWNGIGDAGWFDELDGTQQEFEAQVPASDVSETVETLVAYQVPDTIGSGTYDVEASIRYQDGSIVSGMREIAKNIVVIE